MQPLKYSTTPLLLIEDPATEQARRGRPCGSHPDKRRVLGGDSNLRTAFTVGQSDLDMGWSPVSTVDQV